MFKFSFAIATLQAACHADGSFFDAARSRIDSLVSNFSQEKVNDLKENKAESRSIEERLRKARDAYRMNN